MDGSSPKSPPARRTTAKRASRYVGAEACRQCSMHSDCVFARRPGADLDGLHPQYQAFSAGDSLAREGDVAQEMKVVRSGLVYGLLTAVDGPRPTGFLSRGAVVGKSSYHGEPNPATVTAASAGVYCSAPTSAVVSWAERDPAFRRSFELAVVRDLLTLMHWVATLGRPGVAAQLAGTLLLLTQAQQDQHVVLPSHSLLARLLGTTRETVARMLGQLEADGCLERHRPRHARVHADRLQAWLVQETQAGSRRETAQASWSGQLAG